LQNGYLKIFLIFSLLGKDMSKPCPFMAAFLFLILAVSPVMGQEGLPALIKKVEPSIVVIVTYDQEGKILGQGSGFFINHEGDVVTNFHVLQEASHAVVRTNDGKEYPVEKIVAEDKAGDLIRVSVKILKETVRPLSIVTTLPEVGERIVVIGTPLGLDKTVSDGIVSAVRKIPGFGNIIQVTAPISPGSSGSPVINMKGEVVGVATFFVVAGQNLNFAIPGERIVRLVIRQGETLSERETGRIRDWLASAEGLYAIGLRLLWAEDCERALPYFVETVKRNPEHAEAYFQIGYCLAKLGQYKEAIESYKQALRITPKEAGVHSNLCAAYGKIGRYDEAIESCKEATQLKPDFAEAYSNLGWSYQRVGRYQEAIQACKQAIRLKPDFSPAHYNLGNSYSALKKYEEAIDSYKEAIRITFDFAEGHLNLGAAYFHTGRFEEAIDSYKQAIRLKPSLAEAHLNLGMSYLKLGDRGSAIEEYKILKGLNQELANKLFNLIYE
jgi:tetratricopeptide (TPR) repeat protein